MSIELREMEEDFRKDLKNILAKGRTQNTETKRFLHKHVLALYRKYEAYTHWRDKDETMTYWRNFRQKP